MHPSPRCFLAGFGLGFCLLFWSCQKPLEIVGPPASWQNQSLRTLETPGLLAELLHWLPRDPEILLVAALSEKDAVPRLAELRKAQALSPRHPLILWALSAALAENGDFSQALVLADAALASDPGNALLDLWRARMTFAAGDAPKARMLFFASRHFEEANGYGPLLETGFLRAMSAAGKLNPLSLTEAMGLFAQLHWPPLEESMDVLREVFLDSLGSRPYDIGRRAPQAALRLVWAGQLLRRQSLAGPGILWDGMRERALGYAFEAKGWEFLALHGEAFHRADLQEQALIRSSLLQMEAEAVLPAAQAALIHSEGFAYLNAFQGWSHDTARTVGRILQDAGHLPLWKRVRRIRG